MTQKFNFRFGWDKLQKYPGYAFVFVNLFLLLLYLVFTYKQFFHSDAATKMLLAAEVIKHGTIIPPDWYFLNGDIWVFFIHLPLILLEKTVGYGWPSYVINSLIYLGIYAGTVVYFLKYLQVDFYAKILLFVMAFSALSYPNTVMFFGELSGIEEAVFIFASLGLLLAFQEHPSKKIYGWMAFLVFVFIIGNPGRATIYHIAPLLLAVVLLLIDTRSKKYLALLGTILLSSAVAAAVYSLLLAPHVEMIQNRSNLSFASYQEIFMNVDLFCQGLFSYFSLVGNRSTPVESFEGGIYFFNFLFVLFLLTAMVKMTRLKTEKIDLVNIVSFFSLFYLIVIGYLYIFANPLARDQTTFRYFRPLFYLAMIFLTLYIDTFNRLFKNILITIMLLYLTVSNYKNFLDTTSLTTIKNMHNPHQEVADYLVDHNLTYGFASYWNAGSTMALTKNKSIVAPIFIDRFAPQRWLSAESWYHDYETQRTFLLLTKNEYGSLQKTIKEYLTKEPVEKVDMGRYIILIYDYNIAKPLNRVKEAEEK
jgi:hypothetical protein